VQLSISAATTGLDYCFEKYFSDNLLVVNVLVLLLAKVFVF